MPAQQDNSLTGKIARAAHNHPTATGAGAIVGLYGSHRVIKKVRRNRAAREIGASSNHAPRTPEPAPAPTPASEPAPNPLTFRYGASTPKPTNPLAFRSGTSALKPKTNLSYRPPARRSTQGSVSVKIAPQPQATAPKPPKPPKESKPPKPPKAPKAPSVPDTTGAEVSRIFQPGRLPGETRKQASARHKAEHAAVQAAKPKDETKKTSGKKKPKNLTKAPPSVEVPKPPAAETAPPVERVTTPTPPPAAPTPDAGWGSKRQPGETRKQASARRKATWRAEQAASRSEKAAGKAASTALTKSPVAPPRPAVDLFTNYRGMRRTAENARELKQDMHSRTNRRLWAKDGNGPSTLGPIEKATVRQFPPLQSSHMVGSNTVLAGERGNFRVYQGAGRADTIVQHRSGRQINLPFNPNKQGPVNVGGILDQVNKGNNERAFLKGGWSKTTGNFGDRSASRIGRFAIGAAKRGGLLGIAAGAAGVLAAKALGPVGFLSDSADAGEGNGWLGRSQALRAASTKNVNARHAAQRTAVQTALYERIRKQLPSTSLDYTERANWAKLPATVRNKPNPIFSAAAGRPTPTSAGLNLQSTSGLYHSLYPGNQYRYNKKAGK